MKHSVIEYSRSLIRFGSFILWYVLAVGVVFYALPKAAMYLQVQYEALPVMLRMAMAAGLLLAIVAGLIHASRSSHHEVLPARLDRRSRP